jgi:hypothetical protein
MKKAALRCGFFSTLSALMQSGGLNPAKAISHQDKDEKGERKADTQRQCPHRAIALAFVAHKKYQGRAKA